MGVLFRKQGRLGGFWAKCPSFFYPPRRGKTGEELRAPAVMDSRSWGMVAAGIRGKRGRVSSGFDSPPQFQRRGPAERSTAAMAVAGRRRPWAVR